MSLSIVILKTRKFLKACNICQTSCDWWPTRSSQLWYYCLIMIRLRTVCLRKHFNANDPRFLFNVFSIRRHNKFTEILLSYKKRVLLLHTTFYER